MSNEKHTQRIDRAQTANDYLIGVVILLLTITTAFGFFPGLFAPFEEPVSSEKAETAEILADELLGTNATPTGERTVSFSAFNQTVPGHEINTSEEIAEFGAQAGVEDWTRWSATIRTADGEDVGTYGNEFETHDGAAAVVERFVRLEDHGQCESGCDLIVRVW